MVRGTEPQWCGGQSRSVGGGPLRVALVATVVLSSMAGCLQLTNCFAEKCDWEQGRGLGWAGVWAGQGSGLGRGVDRAGVWAGQTSLVLFLQFNDILIYASSIAPAGLTYRVIQRIPLDGMRVGLLDDPEMKYGFIIVSTCKSFRLEAT